MSFAPNPNGPTCQMGELACVAPGTSLLLNTNWSPKYDASPVTASAPQQYAIVCSDIIINPNPNNAGGVYVVVAGGSKNTAADIVLYIPKTATVPVHLAQSLGPNRFAPHALALDFDQGGDKATVSGVIV